MFVCLSLCTCVRRLHISSRFHIKTINFGHLAFSINFLMLIGILFQAWSKLIFIGQARNRQKMYIDDQLYTMKERELKLQNDT